MSSLSAVRSPLVYSCSGCSSAAQMANHLALTLDRGGLAEMSCIAGVGGGVPGLVRTACSGRSILALDGCVMHCVAACLAREGLTPDLHLTLSDYGVRKRKHADFDRDEAQRVLAEQVLPRLRSLLSGAAGSTQIADARTSARQVPDADA